MVSKIEPFEMKNFDLGHPVTYNLIQKVFREI